MSRKIKRGYQLQPLTDQQKEYRRTSVDQTAELLSKIQLVNVPVVNPNQPIIPQLDASVSKVSSIPSVPVPFHRRFSSVDIAPPVFQPVINTQETRPFNDLFSINLMEEETNPSILDLRLPPPPILVPAEKVIVPSETSNAPTNFIRSTLNAVPKTKSLFDKLGLPFALVIKPYQYLHDNNNPPPLCEDGIITRCRRCRAYINPFITLIPNTRKWRCNFCRLVNEFPTIFNLDPFEQRQEATNNLYNREEIKHAVMEYVAPPQYSSGPQPPSTYNFVIDVSYDSIQNGTFWVVCNTLKDSLDMIPNHDGRTLISLTCVSHKLHHFKIPFDSIPNARSTLYEVTDFEKPYLPATPNELLVPLIKCKENLRQLLTELPTIFSSPQSNNFALGPALKTLYQLLATRGGRIVVISTSIPDVGEASLVSTIKKQTGLSDADKGYNDLLRCHDAFYKNFPIECNKSQISVDLFLTGSKYLDLATLSNLSRYTGGQTYYYPEFSEKGIIDSVIDKFSFEFNKYLSMDFSMETVMRARTSRGVRTDSFYGHFFNRSSDLCAFSSMPRDQSYVFELSLEENITSDFVYVQIAVLLSLNNSQRRIKIITLGIPATSMATETYASVDQLALFTYYTRVVSTKVLNSTLTIPQARDYIINQMVALLSTFKKEVITRHEGGRVILKCPSNMKILPLLMHCLSKSLAFQPGDRIPIDIRANKLNQFESIPLKYLIKNIYPTIYSLHDMNGIDNVSAVNASLPKLENYGIYLIDNGLSLYLWVGGMAVERLLVDVFGVHTLAEVPIGEVELPYLDGSAFNNNIKEIISQIRNEVNGDSILFQPLYIVIGPTPDEQTIYPREKLILLANLRVHALNNFIEDSIFHMESYREFLQNLMSKVK